MRNPKTILLVDDELPVLRSLAKALAGEGYQLSQALSGDEALALTGERDYDVVVTDLMMPGMNGLELLRTLRRRDPGIPLIMITGYPSVKAAVESIKAGAFDYLPKPFTPEELRGQVARALARRGLDVSKIAIPPVNGYCIPENSWMIVQENGNVRIGAHPVFLETVGTVAAVELPNLGEMRFQGEPCVKLMDSFRRLHTLWSPASGKVLAVNQALAGRPSGLGHDPFIGGWLLEMTPVSLEEDIRNLVPIVQGG